MSAIASPLSVDTFSGYESLTALQVSHLALLEQRRSETNTPALFDALNDFIERGIATGLILAEDNERRAAQSLLDYWANALHRAGVEPPEAMLADFDESLAPILPDELCPYVGLAAFYEDDSKRFFGREQLIKELIEHLGEHHLLAVVGASGSGKSSVVRAGLIPLLKAGILPGSKNWIYLPPIVPGSDPLANLAKLIRPPSKNAAQWNSQVAEGLRKQSHLLAYLVKDIPRPIVVTIDQFEEVFTLCPDERDRQAFVDNLLSLVQAPEQSHIVILTMRSDFEEFIQRMPLLQEYFVAGRIPVLPLSAAEVREAIERPASEIGLKFQQGVVERLLQDILGEPAGLPLLQFTLLKLWEKRKDKRNRVTLDVYEQVGGGRLALARSADEFYDGLIPQEQNSARRILLKMVQPGEGLEITSSRILQTTLFTKSEDRDQVKRVLKKLIETRLVRLTPGDTQQDDQVEVAHEALIRNWPTLVEWLEKERDALRQRLRLRYVARQWDSSGRNPVLLWSGTLLREAIRFDDLDTIENAFLSTGVVAEAKFKKEKQRAEREREEARQRALGQAQALAAEQEERAKAEGARAQAESERAEAERQRAEEQSRRVEVEQRRAEEQARSAKRLRRAAIGLFGALLMAIAVAILAGAQQAALGKATQDKNTAEAAAAAAQLTQNAAVKQQSHAEGQAASAQALSKTANTGATTAAFAKATSEAQSRNANANASAARATVDHVLANFEAAVQTATAVQSTTLKLQHDALTAQAVAGTAQVEATSARQDAQAAQAAAIADREKASQAQAQATAAQAKIDVALAAVAQAQRDKDQAEDARAVADQRYDEVRPTLTALPLTQTAIASYIPTSTGTVTTTPTRTATPVTPTGTQTP